MRAPILSAIIILFLLCACKSNEVRNLTEAEVYSIVNDIVRSDSLIITTVCWKFQTIELSDEMKKEFSEDDLNFIARQKKLFKNPTIRPEKLKWYHWKKKKFVNMRLDTTCNEGFVHHFSFPIVSADRKKVIIEIQSDGNCMLGGSGGKDLYEKKNGRWVKTGGFDHWISLNQMTTGNIK
jgi:hypothetical protein